MPDGTVNDRDCGSANPCCQSNVEPGPACGSAADCADEACASKACQGGQCVYALIADGPDPSGQCTHCCEGECCHDPATQCNPAGLCCAPNCAGKQCGPDGCGAGGTCGAGCQPGQTCNASGQCTGAPSCTPQSCPHGCCNAAGACLPGDTNQVCGTDGGACQNCSGQGQVCGGGASLGSAAVRVMPRPVPGRAALCRTTAGR